jgi:hypothetical protein
MSVRWERLWQDSIRFLRHPPISYGVAAASSFRSSASRGMSGIGAVVLSPTRGFESKCQFLPLHSRSGNPRVPGKNGNLFIETLSRWWCRP